MSHGIFDDWRYRHSRLFLSGGKWLIHVDNDDGSMTSKPWHWWNPAHLVRRVIHLLWVRKYW